MLYGFGYDHVNNVYKVLSITFDDLHVNSFKTKVMIYTLGTNSWRMIHGELPLPYDCCELLIFVSGAINWIALFSKNDSTNNDLCVVSFDLVNESHRNFLQPNYGGEYDKDVSLGVLRDCLCIFARRCTFSSVWMVKEYGNEESWTELFRFHYMKDSFCCSNIKPLWIYEDDRVLVISISSLRQSNRNYIGPFMI